MRRRSQLFVLLTLLCCIIFIFSSFTTTAQSYPETVRVGLYFGSNSASSVAFNSKVGLEVGYYQSGQFVPLLAEVGGKQAIVRKDSYFIMSSSGVLTEYNPTEGVPFSGETYGPYHIQIGDKLTDFASAQSMANVINQSGVSAYPVFEDGWAIWTGFYSDENKAKDEVQNLTTKLGTTAIKVINPSSSRLIVYDANFQPKLIFGGTTYKLTVRPNAANNPSVLSVNGKQYRGEIECRRFSDSDMTVINVINIEQYLYGVVPGEIEASAPMEAIKAQAVAARTYTYKSMSNYKKWDFDVVNTVDSQVYGGYDIEKATTNQAINDTKGKKVLYNGQLASLFYFSSSGGMTEDNVNVWGSNIPYLKSVPDPYEAGNSYNYNWSRTFSAADIKMKLFLSGVEIGDILSMTAEEYTPAGRVNKLKITGTQGTITYYKEDIRKILGENGGYLPSRMFTINSGGASGSSTASVISADGQTTINVLGAKAVTSSSSSQTVPTSGSVTILGASDSVQLTGTVSTGTASTGAYVLSGKGWGHAIGMSQEGAKGFARNGYTYDKILMHYFTGVTVE